MRIETHTEETPSSPPRIGQQFSAEQYGMNTPAKAARGTSRRGNANGRKTNRYINIYIYIYVYK